MRNTGLVFYLNAPFRDIWRRIATDRNRPIVQRSTRNELENIYNNENPFIYNQLILLSKLNEDHCVTLLLILRFKLVV